MAKKSMKKSVPTKAIAKPSVAKPSAAKTADAKKSADRAAMKALKKAAAAAQDRPVRPELPSLTNPPTPQDVDPPLYAFPARVIGTLLPLRETIPEEFWRDRTPWNALVNRWFGHDPLPGDVAFHAKPGLNAEKCFRHIYTCLRSFEPKHEHKMAGCAYLASCFFERVEIPSEKLEFKNS